MGSAAGARAREPLAQFPGSPALPPRIPALGVSNFRPGRGWRAPGGKSAVPALPAARTSCDLLGRGVLSALRVRGPGERPLPTRRARRPRRGAEPAVEWRGALQLEPFCAQREVVRCQDLWTLSAPEGRASRAAGCSAPEVSSAPEGVMVRRWAHWAPGLSGQHWRVACGSGFHLGPRRGEGCGRHSLCPAAREGVSETSWGRASGGPAWPREESWGHTWLPKGRVCTCPVSQAGLGSFGLQGTDLC